MSTYVFGMLWFLIKICLNFALILVLAEHDMGHVQKLLFCTVLFRNVNCNIIM